MRCANPFRFPSALLASLIIATPVAAGPLAYVAHGAGRHVSVVDVETNHVVRTIDVGPGPEGIAIAPNGAAVYVATARGNEIAVIDTALGAATRWIGAGVLDTPRGIAITPDSGKLVVANAGRGRVEVFDLGGGANGPFVTIGTGVRGIAVAADGKRWYATESDQGLVVIADLATAALRVLRDFRQPVGIAASTDGKRVYVANAGNATVTAIDARSDAIVGNVAVDPGPTALAVSPDGRRLYVTSTNGSISVVDTTALTKVESLYVGADPRGVAVTPDGSTIVVTLGVDGDVHFLKVATGEHTLVWLGDGTASFGDFIAPDNPTVPAIEYVHNGFGQYFVATDPAEIEALDAGAYGGAWRRTGVAFRVWLHPNPSSEPMCRFFSASFGPTSTHVYTPYEDECTRLAADPAWRFESFAFDVQLPLHAGTGRGQCPPGMETLYRLARTSASGVPVHRYTDDHGLMNRLVDEGWTREGERETGAFACVPR